ncbi:MAG: hypothetical protein ABJC74_07285 [Gemmatimonadota bacterium]
MTESASRSTPLIRATVIGTILQLIMVVAGHYVIAVKEWFAIGGTGISAVAGLLYALWARNDRSAGAIKGGAVAGGVSAFLGIAVSCLLKDVGPMILLIGTGASAIGGVVGGLVGKFLNQSAE